MAKTSTQPTSHVFGPVPSRRLGRSLGVDLIPFKVCSLDCVYCQVGRTTCKTTSRRRFVPVETIVAEVRERLERGPAPDYVTLSGSGEPTLYADLEDLIGAIRRVTSVPLAVLTNGTLLYDPDVRRACARADLVMPSLDAGDEETFRAINRPAPELTLARVVAGMAAFREAFAGPLWLEVFLIAGRNSSPEHVGRIRALAERVNPDRIQLNTAVRPTAEESVRALSPDRMAEICTWMGPKTEVIADFRHVHKQADFAARAEDVLAMIRRRPVTLDDMASGLGIHPNEASKYVEELLGKGVIRKERRGERNFFRAE